MKQDPCYLVRTDYPCYMHSQRANEAGTNPTISYCYSMGSEAQQDCPRQGQLRTRYKLRHLVLRSASF